MTEYEKSLIDDSIRYDLPLELVKVMDKRTVFKKLKKKTVFIEAGEYQENFFYLTKGIARAYIVGKNGKEFTRTLFATQIPIVSIKAFLTNSVSSVNYDCLTNCEMFIGNFNEFIELTKTNLTIANIYSKMLEQALANIEDRAYELSLPAKEKYESLKRRIPNIDNLIPQYQIASYLGVTPVQLSRIRHQ